MRVLKKFAQAALLSLALLLLTIIPGYAASDTSKAPESFDRGTSSFLTSLLDAGAKAYYLGNRSGLDGWLFLKGNQIQVVYITADKKTIIIGAMFGPDGYNVTSDQVQVLLKGNTEVSTQMMDAFKQQTGAGAGTAGVLPGQSPAGGASTVAANKALNELFPPSERLLQDLQDAAGVVIGDAKAPVLYMVMDPDCPHCKATWRVLRDSVFKNVLRVRLVPIGRDDDSERAAAQLLHVADPLNAWNKYVDGDKTQLEGTPDQKLLESIQANHALIDRWSIHETPYLLYRSKTGKIKVLAGEPDHAADLLSDIGP